MQEKNHGIQIFSENGETIVDVGAHVLRDRPEFARLIGQIAAAWSQAEVNLNCLFALLLNTTPEDAAKKIKKHGSAARASEGARQIAEQVLSKNELAQVLAVLDELDAVRLKRNRIQHDVWVRKGSDSLRMYNVHANRYLRYITEMVEVMESQKSQSIIQSEAIQISMDFASEIMDGYSISDLEGIEREIDKLSKSMMQLTFIELQKRINLQ